MLGDHAGEISESAAALFATAPPQPRYRRPAPTPDIVLFGPFDEVGPTRPLCRERPGHDEREQTGEAAG